MVKQICHMNRGNVEPSQVSKIFPSILLPLLHTKLSANVSNVFMIADPSHSLLSTLWIAK